jgi:hypothetical protein
LTAVILSMCMLVTKRARPPSIEILGIFLHRLWMEFLGNALNSNRLAPTNCCRQKLKCPVRMLCQVLPSSIFCTILLVLFFQWNWVKWSSRKNGKRKSSRLWQAHRAFNHPTVSQTLVLLQKAMPDGVRLPAAIVDAVRNMNCHRYVEVQRRTPAGPQVSIPRILLLESTCTLTMPIVLFRNLW